MQKQLTSLKVFLILGAVVFLSYGNTLFNQFVWDDAVLIVDNPYVKDFKFAPNVFKGDLSSVTTLMYAPTGYYRPLSMLSFMVDYRIWRLNPLGYHLTNILIHLLNCFIIFLIIKAITKDARVSFFTGILFAIHPIHVEAIAPIFNRMGIQASFFMLASFLLFILTQNSKKNYFLIGSFLSLFFGLLSKEEAIILPVIFVCYDYFFLSGLRLKNLFQRRKTLLYLPYFFICLGYLVLRACNITHHIPFPFLNGENTVLPALAKNISLHLTTVVEITAGYVVKALFPFSLSALYWVSPAQNVFEGKFLSGALILTAIFFGFYLARRKNDIAFFITFFFISILPFCNVIPISEAYTFHERFLYFASIGSCYLTVKLFLFVYERLKKINSGRIGKIIFAGAGAGCLIFTITANYPWRTDLSLWKRSAVKTPQSRMAHLNLGYANLEKGRLEEALAELEKSKSVKSEELLGGDSLYLYSLNVGKIYTEFGQYEKAETEIQKAVSIAQKTGLNPFAAFDKLGILYAKMGRFVDAEKYFKMALSKNNNFVTTRYNLGVLYYERKDYEGAGREFKRALELDHDFPFAVFSLGLVYLKQDKPQEARVMFQEALAIDPHFKVAQDYLKQMRGL